jgi:glycoprotein endo-alpha-1,2-mannosidase
MIRHGWPLIAAAALLRLSGPSSAGTVLLEDDFASYAPGSDGAPLWQAYSGTWEVTGEGLEGTDCEGDFTAIGVKSGRTEWQDYTLSLRLKVLSRGADWRDGPWLGVRYQGPHSAYTVGFYTRMTALHKASAGRSTGDENPLATCPTTILDKEWHEVAVTVKGAAISVALDGQVIIEATDDGWDGSPPVASGGVALAARKWETAEGSTRVVFRDVRVEAIGEVPEEMKLTKEDAATSQAREASLLEFLRQRRDRRYAQVPRRVLAFYYTWYGTPELHGKWVHWGEVKPEEHDIAASTHYPTKGAYDSHDPEIIDWHIDMARSHGLDGFISTWWGQGTFDDRAFQILLDRAAEKDFEVTVYWETAPGKGRAQISHAVSDLLYLLDNYGSHPGFLKMDGKPVIFVYGRVMNQVPLSSWPAIISETEERYGRDFLLIADGYKESYARAFDGVHTYNICGWVRGKDPDQLRDMSAGSFSSAVELARQRAKISCITVIPGYDDTKVRTPGLNAERQDGKTYQVLWEQAIEADPDWVLITSWNEWHEGSEIEPSWEHGSKYLEITGEYAAGFKATPHSMAEVPPQPAGIDPERARALRELYAGRRIGILPDYGGEAAFWLADTGLDLRELAWEELLEPEKFSARALPIAVYAAGERYVETVREQGDVERALQRYLREGGLLVVIPHGPFPFYYNEKGETVVAAGRLGLPIAGSGALQRADVPAQAAVRGWEEPPAGAKLTFHLDTEALPGLPDSLPFPDRGDLRWRPATGALTAERDLYHPLAELRDEDGNSYGDGIVYLEHKAGALENGKVLYVWMRMPDILGADELFSALFRFAAERIR